MLNEPFPISRRSFTAGTLHALFLSSLFQQATRADALEGSLKWSARLWLRELDEASSALAAGGLAPREWQRAIEDTLGRVVLRDFLRSLDFETLARSARFPAQAEGMQRLYFPQEDGRLQPLAFRPYLFTLEKGVAVVPHGHHNMATMHMVLQGEARVRHFDKLEADASHMLIRPAGDVTAHAGDVSSISDDHHNIHWFQALSGRVLMFNIGVYQVRPGPFGERDYIDPLAAAQDTGGLLRAARLARDEAYAKYGHG
ncbi:hypothetical protein LZ009_01800 [Ramlibacter sp. XY19]|uniref:hypothetical protein n=1 Tax=Ramlibacter paludis TaxID=2908000 RepID=UPI0023DBD44F|nr:hypothetical protein [Ramlibacter paludis]MCG2591514.1 hypothetical protein [Ramlibacter paludis]